MILVRWGERRGEVLIVKMTCLRKAAIPLLVWQVIEYRRVNRWMRMWVLWWTWIHQTVRCVELRSRGRMVMRSMTIWIFTVLIPMAKPAPASGPSVVT